MSQVTIGVIMLFGILLFLIVIRIPIAFALGISSVITAIYLDIPLVNLFMKMVTSMQSFVIIAAPFFVVMAQLMSDGGITKKLMRFCDLIVGRIRGGTAIVNIKGKAYLSIVFVICISFSAANIGKKMRSSKFFCKKMQFRR